MPIILLGLVVAGSVAIYMYFFNNKEKYVKKNEPPPGPFDKTYLSDVSDVSDDLESAGDKPESEE